MRWIGRCLNVIAIGLLFCSISTAGSAPNRQTDRPGVEDFRAVYKKHLAWYVPEAFKKLAPGPLARAMLCGGDMQPSFISDEEWEELSREKCRRIGVSLKNLAGLPTIVGVSDTDASKLVSPGAVLLAVDGERILGKDWIDIQSNHLVPAGNRSRLTILSPNAEVLEIEIAAGGPRRPIPPVARAITVQGGKVGYLRIPVMQPGQLTSQCHAVLGKGITGLVLDLRDCQGWLEAMVVDAAASLVPEGRPLYIARTKIERGVTDRRMVAKPGSSALPIPIVLLINEGTAGGAEILAAALIDNGTWAIGHTTFGSGLIRLIRRVDALGGYLSVLKGEYLRVTGDPLFPKGVVPQRQVEMDRAKLFYLTNDAARDAQLQAALSYLKNLK